MKEVFKVGDVEYAVLTPTVKQEAEAKTHYMRAFNKALTVDKALLREALDDYMVKQGLWSEEKQEEYNALSKRLNKCELALDGGNMKVKDGQKIALEMRGLRQQMNSMMSERTRLDGLTAQGIADNEKFNYLFSLCFVYNSGEHEGKPYFKDYEDFQERADDEPSRQGIIKFMSLIYKVDADFQKKHPENKFLLRFKLVDDKLRLVNKDGKFVDENGRSVDENGRYLNDKGQFTDVDGQVVDEAGNYVVEFKPFLDDDGKPIIEDDKEPAKKKSDLLEV